MYDNWGLKHLGKLTFDESIGETASEALAADLALETAGREALLPGVAQCGTAGDFVSREILVEILTDTEEHIDFLETQLGLLRALGETNYLQSAAGELGLLSSLAWQTPRFILLFLSKINAAKECLM